MEDFGTVSIRAYVMLPAGKYSRSKAVVLHRFHGLRTECLEQAARFVKANPQLRGEMHVSWEAKQSIHMDDLPKVDDNDD